MKIIRAFIALMLVGFAADAARALESVKALDADCLYVTRSDGRSLTYREVLEVAIETFSAQPNIPHESLISRVSQDFHLAMRIFDNGPISKEIFETEFAKDFNYTAFKLTVDRFWHYLNQERLPLRLNAEAGKFVYDLKVYDINHALEGILQNNAYKTTGGDS